MILDDIRDELFKIQDIEYRDFNSKLIPTVKKEDMIGVRTPELRKYAKKLLKEEGVEDFYIRYHINILMKISFMHL